MNLKDKFEGQMSCSKCFLAALVPILVFAGFVGVTLPILFTTSILILSSIFFTSSKHKSVPVEISVKDEALTADQECFHLSPQPESEIIRQQKEVQQVETDQFHDYMVGKMDSFSESESIDQSSISDQDSEIDGWPFAGNVDQSPDCSDDSISDEESLIEIALPSGHYVDPKKEVQKPKFQQKFQDFSPESIFRQHGLLELLGEVNDMNEEDNLIEIDISMGSIKCSRFEIEA